MTPQELSKLKNDVYAACVAAERAVAGKPNSGTRNFDRPVLNKNGQFSCADDQVREALTQGGVRPFWADYENCRDPGWHIAGLPGWGGDVRSLAARSFCDEMTSRGWDCSLHSHMD